MFVMAKAVNDPNGVFMEVVQIDESGRFVISPDTLRRMGWKEGQRLDMSVDATGRVTLREVLQH